MDINQAVAAQLRAARAAAQLTMDDVVARCDISKSSLVRYEKGDREIPLTTIAMLAPTYGVTFRHIITAALTDVEERTPPPAHGPTTPPPAPTQAGPAPAPRPPRTRETAH